MNTPEEIANTLNIGDTITHLKNSFIHLHESLMEPDRIPVAIMAILFTAVLGVITGPRMGNAYPMLWGIADKTIGAIGARLDKTHRPVPDLIFRGFIVTMFSIVLFVLCARLLEGVLLSFPYQDVTAILLLSICLSSGSIWYSLLRLYSALEKKNVASGTYLSISRSSRIDLTSTDDFGITRTGMALAARGFDKAIVAPVLWFLIGGFPVLFLYSCLSFLSWRFAKDGFTKGFGIIPLGLEKVMGFIPSILSGFLITLASLFTPTAKLVKGLLSWFQNKTPSPYEQGGKPLKAMAWALNISLGGAVQDLDGSSLKNAWVGPSGATAKTNHKHLRRGIYISIVAHFLFIAALGGAYMWSGIIEKLAF